MADNERSRRRFLQGCTALGAVGIAGCTGVLEETTATPPEVDDTDEVDPLASTETDTATPTRTEPESGETEAPTETATPKPTNEEYLASGLTTAYDRAGKLATARERMDTINSIRDELSRKKQHYLDNPDELTAKEVDNIISSMERINNLIRRLLTDYVALGGQPEYEQSRKERERMRSELKKYVKLNDYDAIVDIFSSIGDYSGSCGYFFLQNGGRINQFDVNSCGEGALMGLETFRHELYTQMYNNYDYRNNFALVYNGSAYFSGKTRKLDKIFDTLSVGSGEKLRYAITDNFDFTRYAMISRYDSPAAAKSANDRLVKSAAVVEGTRNYGSIQEMQKIAWTNGNMTGYGLTKSVGPYNLILSAATDEYGWEKEPENLSWVHRN